jgi:hypothetical protein
MGDRQALAAKPWGADQVLALAPDATSPKAARSLAVPTSWVERGAGEQALWGLCQGSGARPYQTCVDLTEPAYRCSCPSRKFPCKHALALMLLWSAGSVPEAPPPEWVREWLASRTERRGRATARAETRATRQADPRTAQRRENRVAAGVDELDRWLGDQVRQGLAGAARAGYSHWDTMAARLVDAQAGGLANAVRRLASVAGSPDRLLTELSLLRLLTSGYRRRDELPPDLAATVRSRVGLPVATEDVLAGARIRDVWTVTGGRDDVEEWLTTRRTWLHGSTGDPALVLAFAPPGQSLPSDLPVGASIDADLCFYPGAAPLRALVASRHSDPTTAPAVPTGASVAEALHRYALAIAAEPWVDRWPLLLAGVCPVAGDADRWYLRDAAGDALPLDPALGPPWPLIAFCGGAGATVMGEWSTAGLRPLTAWVDDRMARL